MISVKEAEVTRAITVINKQLVEIESTLGELHLKPNIGALEPLPIIIGLLHPLAFTRA